MNYRLILDQRAERELTSLPDDILGRSWHMKQEKNEILDLIRRLPDDVTITDIMEELYFKQQVDKGLQDVAEGRVLSHEELKERIAQWRQSAGR